MTAAQQPHRVEINIERLVLEGFSPRDRIGIADALQQELSRLLSEHGVPSSLAASRSINRIDAGTISIPAPGPSPLVGAQVAQSIYRGISK